MKVRYLLLISLCIALLAGCAGPQAVQVKSTPIPTPVSGKSTVIGKLFNKANQQPIKSMLVRLAPIYGEGKDAIYVFNESQNPGANTDDSGVFQFFDVQPGSYAVLLTDSAGYTMSINATSEKILVADAASGKIIDLGNVQVDLSAPTPSKK